MLSFLVFEGDRPQAERVLRHAHILGPESVPISGEVRWQSCGDEVCDIPTSRRFELTLPVSQPPAVALGDPEGAALEPNAVAHFLRMSERRKTPG